MGNFLVGVSDDPSAVAKPDEVEDENMVLYTEEGTKIFKNGL